MPGDGSRLRNTLYVVGEQLETGHVGSGPSRTRQRAKKETQPQAVGDKRETQVGQGRQAGSEQINPAHR
jgi:hypothetical protein